MWLQGAAVERSGAAQGLAEVLAVMGAAHLSTLLPEMLENTASKNVFVREGHLTLFKFLPLAMPEVFQVRPSVDLIPTSQLSITEIPTKGSLRLQSWWRNARPLWPYIALLAPFPPPISADQGCRDATVSHA